MVLRLVLGEESFSGFWSFLMAFPRVWFGDDVSGCMHQRLSDLTELIQQRQNQFVIDLLSLWQLRCAHTPLPLYIDPLVSLL